MLNQNTPHGDLDAAVRERFTYVSAFSRHFASPTYVDGSDHVRTAEYEAMRGLCHFVKLLQLMQQMGYCRRPSNWLVENTARGAQHGVGSIAMNILTNCVTNNGGLFSTEMRGRTTAKLFGYASLLASIDAIRDTFKGSIAADIASVAHPNPSDAIAMRLLMADSVNVVSLANIVGAISVAGTTFLASTERAVFSLVYKHVVDLLWKRDGFGGADVFQVVPDALDDAILAAQDDYDDGDDGDDGFAFLGESVPEEQGVVIGIDGQHVVFATEGAPKMFDFDQLVGEVATTSGCHYMPFQIGEAVRRMTAHRVARGRDAMPHYYISPDGLQTRVSLALLRQSPDARTQCVVEFLPRGKFLFCIDPASVVLYRDSISNCAGMQRELEAIIVGDGSCVSLATVLARGSFYTRTQWISTLLEPILVPSKGASLVSAMVTVTRQILNHVCGHMFLELRQRLFPGESGVDEDRVLKDIEDREERTAEEIVWRKLVNVATKVSISALCAYLGGVPSTARQGVSLGEEVGDIFNLAQMIRGKFEVSTRTNGEVFFYIKSRDAASLDNIVPGRPHIGRAIRDYVMQLRTHVALDRQVRAIGKDLGDIAEMMRRAYSLSSGDDAGDGIYVWPSDVLCTSYTILNEHRPNLPAFVQTMTGVMDATTLWAHVSMRAPDGLEITRDQFAASIGALNFFLGGKDNVAIRPDAARQVYCIPFKMLDRIYDMYIGPLGVTLKHYKGLTEHPCYLPLLEFPLAKSLSNPKQRFKRIFYDPRIGSVTPSYDQVAYSVEREKAARMSLVLGTCKNECP